MASSSNGALRNWDAELDAYLADQAAEPITFDWAGKTWRVPRPLPLGELIDFVRDVARGNDAIAYWDLIPKLMDEEDGRRFESTLRSRKVPREFVRDLVEWVIAEGMGRPTPGREDSSTPSSERQPYSKRRASQLAVAGSANSAPEKP